MKVERWNGKGFTGVTFDTLDRAEAFLRFIGSAYPTRLYNTTVDVFCKEKVAEREIGAFVDAMPESMLP